MEVSLQSRFFPVGLSVPHINQTAEFQVSVSALWKEYSLEVRPRKAQESVRDSHPHLCWKGAATLWKPRNELDKPQQPLPAQGETQGLKYRQDLHPSIGLAFLPRAVKADRAC